MSDIMTPIPFGNLMTWIVEEHKRSHLRDPASFYCKSGKDL